MTRMQKLRVYLARKMASATQVISSGLTPLSPELIAWLGGSSASSKAVNEQTALTLATAWSCMRIISEALGALSWEVYRRLPNGSIERAIDHPLSLLLTVSPNEDMTPVELREAIGLNLCQRGNFYAFRDVIGADVTNLYPIPSKQVLVKKKRGGNTTLNLPEGAVFYSVNDNDRWTDYTRDRIWHVKGFGPSGIEGLSPLACARESMGFALATDEFGAKFFSQGGKPSGIVTIPGFLTEDQRKIARENLQQMMGGLGNAHKFALFEGGMTPKEWSHLPLADLEFLALRQFNVAEMCRIYRIPPHMVADVQRGAAYASIEQMSAEFVMFTLLPYFTRVESSISKWLVPEKDRATIFVRFNYEALLRADSKNRADFYASALQNGWMTRNEVRSKENLNSATGLDEFTAQTNLAPVGKLGALTDATVSSKRPGAAPMNPPPPMKTGDTHVSANFALPSMLRHEVEHAHPAIITLADSVAAMAKNVARSHDEVVRMVEGSTDRIAEAVLEGQASLARRLTDGQQDLAKSITDGQATLATAVTKLANRKTRLTFDEAGNPVGAESTEA